MIYIYRYLESRHTLINQSVGSTCIYTHFLRGRVPLWLGLSQCHASLTLKGQLHGRAEIFKGLKMTFKTKILKKKYTTLISIKNTTNFVLTTFLYNDFCFLTALLIAVKFNFSNAPRHQDNLSKLLSALSAIAAPSAGTLTKKPSQILKGARGGDGGERVKQLW